MLLKQVLKAAGVGLVAGLILATIAPRAEAKCLTNDKWNGPDKIQHAGIGGVAGFLFSANSGKFSDGLKAGIALGVGKELIDLTGDGTCSLQDAMATIIGSAVGAGLGVGLSIMVDRNAAGQRVTTVAIHKEF